MISLEFESRLDASPDEVWHHAVSVKGINAELGPWIRMTFPAGVTSLDTSPPLNQCLFRSWLLLFGILPIDYDDIAFEAIEPGRRFQEASTLMSQRIWRHERIVEPADGGCLVIDRLEFSPRVPGTGTISRFAVAPVFRHRHAVLRRRFGSPSKPR